MITDLQELKIVLLLKVFSEPEIAARRDEYMTRNRDLYHQHIDECVHALVDRDHCWDCGTPALETADGFPTCAAHPVLA